LKEIENRLAELGDEVSKLEAARTALVGNGHAPAAPARTSSPRTQRSPAVTPAATEQPSARRPGRPRGRRAGTRTTQALELVRGRPGITIPELAKEMSIEPNYLYRVLPKLATDGQVKRDGQGWHPAS
jgi:hypothetical protein